jgi:hypothetical protein
MRLASWMLVGAAGLGLLVPASASAAGGPVPPQQGGAGASAPGGDVTYVALSAGPGRTVVERVARAGGAVERSRLLHGSLGVPGIAYDGSTTGLSADGGTLVLGETIARYPVRRTRLAVLDARSLTVRARIALRGFFTVDAISPAGRRLYLIHYVSSQNGTRYEVRAYDLTRRILLRRPVVDPREPDEAMQGIPVTRAVSADGRWAYTLYSRGDAAPFIHALDTAAGAAVCVDLPGSLALTVSQDRLALLNGGRTLAVSGPDATLALLDTRTMRVRAPAAARPTPSRPAGARGGGGNGRTWALLLLLPLAALGAAGARRARPLRRRTARSTRRT